MKLTPEQRKMAHSFAARLEQSRVDRGNAILKAQEAARAADNRPAEIIVREARDEWDRDPPSPGLEGSTASGGMNRGSA